MWRTTKTSTQAQKPSILRCSPSRLKACSWLQPTGPETEMCLMDPDLLQTSDLPEPSCFILQGRLARLRHLQVERWFLPAVPEHQHSGGPRLEALYHWPRGESSSSFKWLQELNLNEQNKRVTWKNFSRFCTKYTIVQQMLLCHVILLLLLVVLVFCSSIVHRHSDVLLAIPGDSNSDLILLTEWHEQQQDEFVITAI